jgi:hypothetical protein
LKVEADEVFEFMVNALKSGTSPEVLKSELDAAIRMRRVVTVVVRDVDTETNTIHFVPPKEEGV